MTLTLLILFGLATWRVSKLLVSEAGPFRMFEKLRELTGIIHDDGVPFQIPDRFFAQLLSCVWCASIWVSAGWLILWLITPYFTTMLASLFAFSTVAILAENHISK